MSYATALSKVAELMQKVQQLERENAALYCQAIGQEETIERLQRENTTLRSLAAAMVEEMEQHGGEQAFYSLARYRAEMEKEAKP